ncbi:low-density lipoprotein receptor-related protein 11 isoform X1 [Ochotona curzoniae]|uniref:low-density lipoprotein receptor-related protein 11 isoform X1 n=1 Tax=Ochotona curzoniae TaxID=130825 RepID=UPI001B3520F3|nr:low-density lipoprotein receptor-related protein 11 isoform X1 [Ochotona curzoniae]
MVLAAREGAGSSRPRALGRLLLLCLWLASGRAAGPLAAPRPDLHAQLSGVEQLLEEFRRQLQQERPQEELELELRAGGGPREGCPGRGGGGYSAMPDAIIRTKDSIEAGASFLSAPASVRDWRQCVAACCSEPRCSVAVVELPRRPAPSATALRCYLFNCTVRGRNVCKFALLRGYSSYSLSRAAVPDAAWASTGPEKDEPPQSKAGQNVVLHLPTDEVTLDGRESTDDHAIIHYEWTLLQGDPSVDMKVPQSGTLKLAHLQEGTYTFQLTVTDTAGQRGSDNVSVTVLPVAHATKGCLGTCSRYHFFCDDGCCIDITLACDGERQCPDGSDEAFCQNLGLDRKMATHTATTPAQPRTTALIRDAEDVSLLEKSHEATAPGQPAVVSHTEKNHLAFAGTEGQVIPVMPDSSSPAKQRKEEKYIFESKSSRGEHPAPEAGAVLPLALGLAITALLLLMVTCRLRLVKQKLKKARPITSEESDYLINGMYL